MAVPAILTGQKPKKGALPILRDHPHNLFTLLGKRYHLVVHESQTRLCPQSLCKQKGSNAESRLSSLYSDVRTVYLHLIAPPSLEQRLPVIDESWGNFGGNSGDESFAASDSGAPPKVDLSTFYLSRVRDFNHFVGSFRKPAPGRPTLYFAHILLPHTPWLYFPDGRARAVTSTNAPGRNGERWFNGQLATQAWQRHLLQVGYTDKLLGKFIARLHKVGLWDKALVIVMPDHGISFRGGDLRRRPTKSNLADLAFIPLFVKYPGQTQGRVVDSRHASTLDIVPTIADTLGVTLPWHVDGTSLLKGGAGSGVVDVAGVRESYRAALAQRQAALARQLSLFGSGDWGTRFDGTGPYRDLVGSAVSSLDGRSGAFGVGARRQAREPAPAPLPPRLGTRCPHPSSARSRACRRGNRWRWRSTAGSPRSASPTATRAAARCASRSWQARTHSGPGGTRCARSCSPGLPRRRCCGSCACLWANRSARRQHARTARTGGSGGT